MNTYLIKKILITMGITLFLAGCGDKAPDTGASPDTLPSTLKVKQLSKTYVITGLGLRGTNKVAIINDQVVTPGMELDPGVTLKDVQPTYAVILHGGMEHLIRPENIQNELDKEKR